jgi:SAM-dependent methyltransferase
MRTIPNRQGQLCFKMFMFPQLYHAHHNHHSEDLPFWLKLAAQQAGPIFELGCGTGRVMLALARAGYTMFGLDNDAAMLDLLQMQVSPDLASRCHFFQADMAAFHLERQFALILLPCNTFSALSPTTRRVALAHIRQHLSTNGLFVASLPNPAVLIRLPQRADEEIEEIIPHPIDGEPVQVSSAWQRSAGYFTNTWHYDHLLPDGRVERLTTQIRHTLLSVESYADEFRRAGLRIETLYGDFDQSPYTENSPSLIILAQVEK